MAQRMRDAEAAERSSRLLSEQTLASIADAVIAVDTNRSITFVNPAAADLTGWRSDTACGRRVDEVFRIVSEKTGEPELDPIGFVLTAGSPHRIAIIRRSSRRMVAGRPSNTARRPSATCTGR
jgi:PAS domain-containing protein